MVSTVEQITRSYRISRIDLESWIAHRWLRPVETTEGPAFDEVDEARITLIRELRDELQMGDEAVDLVLSLLDQLYATRRALRTISEAMMSLPKPLQAEIRACIERDER